MYYYHLLILILLLLSSSSPPQFSAVDWKESYRRGFKRRKHMKNSHKKYKYRDNIKATLSVALRAVPPAPTQQIVRSKAHSPELKKKSLFYTKNGR
jgi:hypothetical protein